MMSEDLRKESEQFVRYWGEIVRRIGRGGMTDVAHLVALYEQLKRALDSVSVQELAWADQQAKHLIDKLVAMNSKLEKIRRLKANLERDAGEEPPLSMPPQAAQS